MKLFLMWLLGVPLIVTSMVMAQSMSTENHRVAVTGTATTSCSGNANLHDMTVVVAQQRYRVSCDRFSVE